MARASRFIQLERVYFMSDRYIDSNQRMSQVVVHGNTAYLAGQVAHDASAGMRGQTEQILEGIDQLLAKAGTDKSHILSATIWVTDMAEFQEMNTAWDAWVTPGRTPARACVTGNLAKPEWKVEIMVIAAIPA
jgi:enamine deaminase RidA (YjgF/YER057c/UK114 family)